MMPSVAALPAVPEAILPAEPLPPSTEVVAWAAALLRRVPGDNPGARPDIAFLMGEATRSGALRPLNLRITVPGEKVPREVAVEARLPAGLLVRTVAGWRTFVSFIDLYTTHAPVLAPHLLRERVGTLRALVASSNRPH